MNAPLALTLGEPAGIGPDIALAAWLRRVELGVPPFYLLADPAFVARRADALKLRPDLLEDSGAQRALFIVRFAEIRVKLPGDQAFDVSQQRAVFIP